MIQKLVDILTKFVKLVENSNAPVG